ncbi:MAG: signal recognition particle protein [Armatimonadota bacterium]|nr:MAG: signal recognition particle protein [Armatimonadota bacterium]
MFDNLTDKLQAVFDRLARKGRLSEQDVTEACREIRLALLEADVNFKVVKDFVGRVRERAVGHEVLQSLTPGQQVVKVVKEELTELLGGEGELSLQRSPQPPTILMLVGLQGGGKTTTSAKLARLEKKNGRKPLLVATDVRRPAAIEQLRIVGEQVGVPVFDLGAREDPVNIARAALAQAQREGLDPVILDTQGRLHVDEELMGELCRMQQEVSPAETLLVLDAMTGQDAVRVAQEFDAALNVTGFILTKLDGDARGGAAVSIRAVTGTPIKLVGVGEKLDALEAFHPDRMVSRILGMGDVLTLIERAESAVDERQAAELERKLRTRTFDLNDFMEQLGQISKMGPLDQLLDMIPGFRQMRLPGNLEIDPARMKQLRAIMQSMTSQERAQPEIIKGSRRRRIAQGSGTSPQAVNQLLGQFKQFKETYHRLAEMETRGKMPKLRLPWT